MRMRFGLRTTWRVGGLACFLAMSGGGAPAAPLNLPATPYSYTVIDQDLSAALSEFGSNVGIRMNVSQTVRGRVRGRMPEMGAREFLDRLVANYNLQWYYDGQVLHVTTADESQSRLLVLGPVPFDRLMRTLTAFSIIDDRYSVRRAPGAELALVSGPPRFIALVEQTLTGLIAEEQSRQKPVADLPADKLLQVFRGSQAQYIRNGRPEAVLATGTAADAPPAPAIRRPAPSAEAPARR